MSDGIEIFGTVLIANPKPLLACGFETGVVPLALGAQGVDRLEMRAVPVDGKAVVIGDGDIFGAAAVLLAIVPVWMPARTSGGFGKLERATEFLTDTTLVECFPVMVHGKPSIANGHTGRQFLGISGVSGVDGDEAFSTELITNGVVDIFDIECRVSNEIAFPD